MKSETLPFKLKEKQTLAHKDKTKRKQCEKKKNCPLLITAHILQKPSSLTVAESCVKLYLFFTIKRPKPEASADESSKLIVCVACYPSSFDNSLYTIPAVSGCERFKNMDNSPACL